MSEILQAIYYSPARESNSQSARLVSGKRMPSPPDEFVMRYRSEEVLYRWIGGSHTSTSGKTGVTYRTAKTVPGPEGINVHTKPLKPRRMLCGETVILFVSVS